ncbi:DNA polymerase [Proteiniclasticum sp. C24MP]|uniref:DNA polymerase n=1 Tax=Proteiniclasticum sp. C24MP TaxID=3374101 RepID=UPI0037541DC2
MTTAHIDIETYCDLSLKDVGVYKYASHPSFKILLLAYAIDDGPTRILDLENGDVIPDKLEDMIRNTSIRKVAHNAQFERVCLCYHLKTRLDPKNWDCTMIKALTLGLPGSLDAVSKALGFPQDMQKLMTGKNLIRLFSMPRKPSKSNGYQTSFFPDDKPDEWQQFKDYCIQDVEVERNIDKALGKYRTTPDEVKLWELDQRINDRGVALDKDFAKAAVKIDTEYQEETMEQFKKITGLNNPKSVAQLKIWLSDKLGIDVPKVTKETVPELIKAAREKSMPEVVEALSLRQETAKTSTSKYQKMLDVVLDDGRARGLLQFYGASRTGRWAGRLIQVQNLPQNHISDLDTARRIVATGDAELLEMSYDKVPNILSQLIRTAFIAKSGHRFVVADFSAIEARVIAWLSGEDWRMEVFRTHGKIYEASASQMFKVPLEEVTKGSQLRQKGKVSELALGYQGGPGALRSMDRKWAAKASDEELQELVDQWRSSNTAITKFWKDCEAGAKESIRENSVVQIQKGLKFIGTPEYLFIELPSGRRLAYREPKLEESKYGSKITYMGQNQTTNAWETQETYGGKLVENIVQATARDCLAVSMIRVEEAGYKIVMHVHDEIIVEASKEDTDALKKISAIMGKPISWAEGLPLRADAYECDYYQKD